MRSALLLGVMVPLLAGCGSAATTFVPSTKAPPQRHQLAWREQYPGTRPALVFGVRALTVTSTGWKAEISVENTSPVTWEVGGARSTLDRAFGLLLFPTGDLEELERRNRAGTLPVVRSATMFEPPLPSSLEPGTSWRGVISAPGPLAGGLWARVSFGPFASVGDPPAGAAPQIVWFTDHAVRLRPDSRVSE